MKKVLSVALASAMVLGMGVNAFADISYNTGAGTNEVSLKAVGLNFDGGLVVTDKAGVALNTTLEDAEFRPGDVIYMPLYGENQAVIDGHYSPEVEGLKAVKDHRYDVTVLSSDPTYIYMSLGSTGEILRVQQGTGAVVDIVHNGGAACTKLDYQGTERTYNNLRWKVQPTSWNVGDEGSVYVDFPAVAAQDAVNGADTVDEYVEWGPYTGEIGKNWSINFVEKSANYVDKASFYKAKSKDTKLETGAWYIKVELKDLFDSVDDDEVYYKVYVTDNNDRSETDRVYVKGTLSNEDIKYVDFEWTNNANVPAVWHVKKGENGTAVFDFEDKAFFTVKMYSEEKMYLDLSTAYQKAVANEYDAEFDNFFKFQGTNANFSRTGELIIESNDPNLFVYEIDSDNNLYPVDAKYVKDYQVTHTNDKINGYVFNTKTLGNYVLSVDELEVEEDEAPATEAPEEKPAADKENPNTGANDFVGVAVALAVVSVAGAGALALKK